MDAALKQGFHGNICHGSPIFPFSNTWREGAIAERNEFSGVC